MNVYVSLLRGINVGGKNPVVMSRLKESFEGLGLSEVRTYINSGNVIFVSDESDEVALQRRIEERIERDFGLPVPVLLRSREEIERLVRELPADWVNDDKMKCDVMFLWPDVDRPEVVEQIPHKPAIEDVVYFPGAVVWRVDRENVRQGQVPRVIGTDLYRQFTIRNVNTVRKLLSLMKEIDF